MRGGIEASGYHLRAAALGAGHLAELLSTVLKTKVMDETSLAGKYDVNINWELNECASLEAVLKGQLGSTLEPASQVLELSPAAF